MGLLFLLPEAVSDLLSLLLGFMTPAAVNYSLT